MKTKKNNESKLIPELYLLAVSFVFFILAGLLMTTMNALADYRHPGAYQLPDIGFQLIPFLDWPELPNIVMTVMGVSTLIVILIHPKRVTVVRRLLVIYGSLLLLRSITVISTSLPDPSPQCLQLHLKGKYNQKDSFQSLFTGLKQTLVPLQSSTCGDLIFSGHTVFMTLCVLIWKKYFEYHPWVWIIVLIVALFGIWSIIATRFHYSIDVILAVILTFYIWSRYHVFAEVKQLNETDPVMKFLETGELPKVDHERLNESLERASEKIKVLRTFALEKGLIQTIQELTSNNHNTQNNGQN